MPAAGAAVNTSFTMALPHAGASMLVGLAGTEAPPAPHPVVVPPRLLPVAAPGATGAAIAARAQAAVGGGGSKRGLRRTSVRASPLTSRSRLAPFFCPLACP